MHDDGGGSSRIMSHGVEVPSHAAGPVHPLLAPLARTLARVNSAMQFIGNVALLCASLVLTWSVVTRYFLKWPTEWQDEAAVFLLVGSVFLCGAYVQSFRGHVGIEAIASLLPAGANRVRMAIVDVMTLAFCAFFAWKSWTLFHEAYVEHHTTASAWAPPLAIPYGLMAAGMTLLTLQLVLQTVDHFVRGRR
jgi:TRAP-type C4-dicarboxylate transport system permease small subunit